MKNYLVLLASILLGYNISQAQAWDRTTKVLSLGIGASQFFNIDNYYYDNATYIRNYYTPITGQINFQGEFAVHQYVGIGFTTGIGGRAGLYYGYLGEVNVPIGVIANFHFYQLIADKTGKNIHADKLDIYAGINLGGGIAATYYNNVDNSARIIPIVFGGFQAGVRYYFLPRVGVNAELGWGKSLVNAGFAFKL